MKTLSNVERYRCDHCNKEYKAKAPCVKHEQFCNRNQKNRHICLVGCKYLEAYRPNDDWGPRNKMFECTKLKKEMFTYAAERRGLTKRYDLGERMPIECDSFEFDTNQY